jgi:hypothetical protein
MDPLDWPERFGRRYRPVLILPELKFVRKTGIPYNGVRELPDRPAHTHISLSCDPRSYLEAAEPTFNDCIADKFGAAV